MAQRRAAIDAAIIRAWKEHVAGVISFDQAGARHHALVALRDGREVRL